MAGAFAGAALMPAYAGAQDAQADRLQRQIDALQQQLQSLQKQVAETKKSAQQAAQQAKQVEQAYAQVPAGGGPPGPLKAKAPLLPPGVKLSWGGFIEAAGIWRQRNEVADVGSDFNNMPYPISPLYAQNELRFSARQSRLFFMAEGDISTAQTIRAYYEMDFLGAAASPNSIESNSYTPRTRNVYLSYDDTGWGWHVLAGQNWSLLTQNRNGINPRQENIPLTIDAQYVVGFNWSRNPQFRVVKDFGPTLSIAASAESPDTRFQTPGSTAPPGITINSTNLGNTAGLLNPLASYSIDQVPDFIEKIAWDPGWGHYEAFGLQRFFTDNTFCTSTAFGTCPFVGAISKNNNTFGWGVGGSVLLPAIPTFLDLQGSILYGQGIGRYGSGQLPDVTFAADGSLTPITAIQSLVGAVAHATPALDFYVYAGLERDDAKYGSTGGTNFGLGNPLYSDAACLTPSFATPAPSAAGVPASPVTGLLSNTTCSADVKQLEEITGGLWYNFYKGNMGRLTGGLQYEYIHRDTFAGTIPGGFLAPATNESIVMTSLRYYFP
jgi:hypothetical protein